MTDDFPYVAGVRHRYVTANGLRMHVAEAGQGEPLLLLHGWPQHWYMWRYQIPALSQRYHVICPDLRGFGWSDAPATGYAKERLVDDLLALLDALGVERVGLMGHDWGGWIGFLLCLRRPERVGRYLALNIPHPFQQADARLWQAWRLAYQPVIASRWLGAYLIGRTRWFIPAALRAATVNHQWTDAELEIYASRLREPARARASVKMYRAFGRYEGLAVLAGRYRRKRLTTPTLLLFGQQDLAIATDMLRGYERYADDFTLELVPDSGHFIAEDKPDLVTNRALAFFAMD